MAATLTQQRFSGPEWIFQRKFDGIRMLAFKNGSDVKLYSRNRLPQHRPAVAEAIAKLPAHDVILDGEAAWDEASKVGYHVFDILWLDGRDTRGLELRDRKRLLRAAIAFRTPLRYTEHRVGDGEKFYRQACRSGWEGLIAKRAGSPYVPRRSPDWLKFKCVAEQEFVIGGWTDPEGSRTGFGALLVGYYEDGALVYAGKVGTGFDESTLRSLATRLRRLRRSRSPFARGNPRAAGAHWVEPRLVAEVGFTEWTRTGKLRHPRFLGLRLDKAARDVVRETPAATETRP